MNDKRGRHGVLWRRLRKGRIEIETCSRSRRFRFDGSEGDPGYFFFGWILDLEFHLFNNLKHPPGDHFQRCEVQTTEINTQWLTHYNTVRIERNGDYECDIKQKGSLDCGNVQK